VSTRFLARVGEISRIPWKWRFVCHLEDFDFFDFEIVRICKKCLPIESHVVGVRPAKRGNSVGLCLVAMVNSDVPKTLTAEEK
jgi:hypothetical protein